MMHFYILQTVTFPVALDKLLLFLSRYTQFRPTFL